MLNGSIAIVTGSARGIGKEVAIRLISRGAKVLLGDVTNAERTAMEIGSNDTVFGFTCDVSNSNSVKDMVSACMRTFGRVDILVNNAGICPTTPLERITEEEWDKVLGINLKGTFFCAQAVSDIMKDQRNGRIINISSLAGRSGSVVAGLHYSASKAGVIGLTKALARLLGPYNITVNAIAPGTTVTEMTKDFSAENMKNLLGTIPLGKFGQPEYIAEMVVFLASNSAQWITGATIDINGGMYMA